MPNVLSLPSIPAIRPALAAPRPNPRPLPRRPPAKAPIASNALVAILVCAAILIKPKMFPNQLRIVPITVPMPPTIAINIPRIPRRSLLAVFSGVGAFLSFGFVRDNTSSREPSRKPLPSRSVHDPLGLGMRASNKL